MSASNLEKLQIKWYRVLKKTGFDDIEYGDGSSRRGTPNLKNKAPLQVEAIESYFRMARHFLIDHQFERDIDKTIWAYYSEGLSYRDIAKILEKIKVKNLKKSQIETIIKNIESEMLKKYFDELDSRIEIECRIWEALP